MADKFNVYVVDSRSGDRRALVRRLPSAWSVNSKQLDAFLSKGARLCVGRAVAGVTARSMLGKLDELGGVGELEPVLERPAVVAAALVAPAPAAPAPATEQPIVAAPVVPVAVIEEPPVVAAAPVAPMAVIEEPRVIASAPVVAAPPTAVAPHVVFERPSVIASVSTAPSPGAAAQAPAAVPPNRGGKIAVAIGVALVALIGYLVVTLR